MASSNFENRLTRGHPNSLGETPVIVAEVLSNPDLFDALFHCYFSKDETVRLRTSNAMKRICQAQKGLLLPYLHRFLEEVASIEQASTQWTLAQLFNSLAKDMSDSQKAKAQEIMKRNLESYSDWIVLNTTLETLGRWAKEDSSLKIWLLPHLERLSKDSRKSVAKRASKIKGSI